MHAGKGAGHALPISDSHVIPPPSPLQAPSNRMLRKCPCPPLQRPESGSEGSLQEVRAAGSGHAFRRGGLEDAGGGVREPAGAAEGYPPHQARHRAYRGEGRRLPPPRLRAAGAYSFLSRAIGPRCALRACIFLSLSRDWYPVRAVMSSFPRLHPRLSCTALRTVHLDSPLQSAHEGEVCVQWTGSCDTIGAYS
eukprot:296377-Prorocentrum_minimum.AAC.1